MNLQDQKNNYFILFSNCIPVKGARRSLIYDLQNNEIFKISNDIFELTTQFRQNTIQDLIHATQDEQGISNLISFLVQNGLGTIVEDPSFFPELEEYWDHPSLITNSIIDIGEKKHNFAKIIPQLILLGCQYIQIRCFQQIDLNEIENILIYVNNSTIRNVQVLLPFKDLRQLNALKAITMTNSVIKFTVFNCPNDILTNLSHGVGLELLRQNIESHYHCGVINSDTLSVPSVKSFFENKLFNSCLNRKLSIDENGMIKNCPSFVESYGDAEEIDLIDVVCNLDFQSKWLLSKDDFEVCKVCEFRYMCSDCRAFTEGENITGKPRKCGYDPFSATWIN